LTVTTNTKRKDGFFIGVGCPGCGGSLSLDADFFVTRCEHCDSPLRIVMPDTPPAYLMPCKVPDREIRVHVDRYLKQHDLPLTGPSLHVKKLYYPYWKIEASLLKLRNKTETKKLYSDSESQTETVIETDRSMVSITPYLLTIAAGTRIDGVSESLGLRSETVRVMPFSAENVAPDFDVLPVIRTWETVERRVHSAVASLSQISPPDFGTNLTRLFNPSWSLIFFPYFVVETYTGSYRRLVLDGLVGRVVDSVAPETEKENKRRPMRDGIKLSLGGINLTFETGTSPERQHDSFVEDALSREVVEDPAEVEPDSADSVDTPAQVSFGQLDVVFHRCDVCGADLPTELSHIYICPNCHELQVMDRINYRLEQIDMTSFGDKPVSSLVPFWRLGLPEVMVQQFGNLLGGLDRREQMLVPALGTSNFEALHKLAKRMSAAQGKMPMEAVESLDERFLPVRIGLTEALALAEIIICRELLDRGLKLPESSLALEPTSVGLVYVPFHLKNYFYVDSVLNAVSVERALVE
jgi:hypothetical protein